MKLLTLLWILFLLNISTLTGCEAAGSALQEPSDTTSYGTISGSVIDKNTGQGLPDVNITVANTARGTTSDQNGAFRISAIQPGKYAVIFSYVGYARKTLAYVTIMAGKTENMGIIKMVKSPLSLKSVVVAPGSYAIMGTRPVSRQTLTSQEIKTMGWAEDVTRAIQGVPGISGNDFTAKFNIRGGEVDEVLVLLDGMQIYEPFHQKDFGGGLFSTIDIETIGGLDLLTGGYTAEYGHRMSGVLDMHTKTPGKGGIQNVVGLSLLNAHAFSMGSFSDNKGSWLVSARRGYLDVINKLTGNEFKLHPAYYDIMGKLSYKIHSHHTLSAHAFLAKDSYNLDEKVIERGKTVPNIDSLDTAFGNYYGWLTLDSDFTPRLHAQSLLYGGDIAQQRARHLFDDDPDAHFNSHTVNDDRNFKLLGFKQNWNFQASPHFLVKFGLDVKTLSTTFDYSKNINNEFITADHQLIRQTETLAVQRTVNGSRLGFYGAARLQLFEPLTLETGLRYDQASYTDDKLWSPRIALVYSLGASTFLRAAWGYYYQTQNISDLRIEFGENGYHPAELSKHTVLGFEHHFNNGFQIRLEGYYKQISRLQDRYITFRNIDEFFPETRDDLVKLVVDYATAKGVEVYAKYDTGHKISAWLSYVLSDATDDVIQLQYAGPLLHRSGNVPRPWNQKHTINLDLNYRLNTKWHFNAAWQYRSGWPYTPFTVERIAREDGTFAYYHNYGVYNTRNYPAYHRLDIKISKLFFNSSGKITTFLHVINVLNHQNVNNYDFSILSQNANDFKYEIDTETWFGILPFVGINWEF